jgi:predicted RNase H-like nuclease
VVVLDDTKLVAAAEVVSAFADIAAFAADVVAVDIPFVLQAEGWRAADREAKRLLGRRHSTIFMTPPAPVVECDTYEAANALCRRLTGGGLSRQMFNLFARVREVAASGVPIYEVHPELAFAAIAGTPLPTKRSASGLAQRRGLLEAAGVELPGTAGHDMLDAAVCALVARRIASGDARALPAGGPSIIWY